MLTRASAPPRKCAAEAQRAQSRVFRTRLVTSDENTTHLEEAFGISIEHRDAIQ